MRVLFAGGTGFIGKTFLDNFRNISATGLELTLLSRNPELFLRRNPELAAGLGRHFSIVRQSLPNISLAGQFDVIIHGAECPSPAFSKDDAAHSAEILQNLMLFAERGGTGRIVYLSSGAIYTLSRDLKAPFELVSEIPQINSGGLYAYSKYMNELALRRFSRRTGIEHVIVRIFNVASRNVPLSGRYALGNFVRDILDPAKAEITITGSGRDRRSFIAGRDLSGLISYCLDRAPPGAIYNACPPQTISILELAKLVGRAAGATKPIVVSSPDASPNDYYGVGNMPSSFLTSLDDLQNEIAQLLTVCGASAGNLPDETRVSHLDRSGPK